MGATTWVSVDATGADSNGDSKFPSISAGGRYVAFASDSSDLVASDGNGRPDVFVRDIADGTTTMVSVGVGGMDANAASEEPSISGDGRFVAFTSSATNLTMHDDDVHRDIFVRDVARGRTIRASVDTAGDDAEGESRGPDVSSSGRYVAFWSTAADLVHGDRNGRADVFVRDLVAGTTSRVSVDAGGGDSNGPSSAPSISSDGRFVAFESLASDLAPPDGNGDSDIYVRDLVSGTTSRVSIDEFGGDPHDDSNMASVNDTGRYVAFYSWANDLVRGDRNRTADVFVRDLATSTTHRVSVDLEGGDANDASYYASISATGRYVAFGSYASDLIPADGHAVFDVFVRDLVAGATTRASVDASGGDPNDLSDVPEISSSGRFVSFFSYASDLGTGDADRRPDVFVRDMSVTPSN